MEIGVALLVSAIIGGVMSWVSSRNANEQAQINQANQNNWNAEQAEISRRWQSPANQMSLYKEAGINPAMAAAGLTGYSGQGIQAASGQGAPAYPADFSHLMDIARAFTSGTSDIANAEKTNKETGWIDTLNSTQQKKLLQEIEESKTRQDLDKAQIHSLNNAAEQLVRMNDSSIEKIKQETNNLIAFNEQIAAETGRIKAQTDLTNKSIEKTEAEIQNITSDTEFNQQQTEESKSKESLNYQLLSESAAKIGLTNTENLLKKKEIDLTNAKWQVEFNNVIISDIKRMYAEKGFFPDSSFLNNLISAPTSIGTQNAKELWNAWNNAVNEMFDKISSFFSGINKGIKEHDSTKNIYGNSWENPNRINWYNEYH